MVALNGTQHLLVMMVDSGPAQKRGLFHLGKNLNDQGVVTGGWTARIDVPAWFSWENQGADVAVPDLGAGVQDLIVLAIDNGPAKYRAAFYRVGHDLRIDGSTQNGWSGWQEIPDWFWWENQGGGITILGPDYQGRGLSCLHGPQWPRTEPGALPGRAHARQRWRGSGRLVTMARGPGLVLRANQGAAVTDDVFQGCRVFAAASGAGRRRTFLLLAQSLLTFPLAVSLWAVRVGRARRSSSGSVPQDLQGHLPHSRFP